MSPSIWVQNGPARIRVRSRTRSPSSAPASGLPGILAAHRRRRVEIARVALEIARELLPGAQPELLEVGRPPGEEGIHPLLRLLRAPDVGQQLHAVLPRRVEVVR